MISNLRFLNGDQEILPQIFKKPEKKLFIQLGKD